MLESVAMIPIKAPNENKPLNNNFKEDSL